MTQVRQGEQMTHVSRLTIYSDDEGLVAEIKVYRPGLAGHSGFEPNVNDMPRDVRMALLQWLRARDA